MLTSDPDLRSGPSVVPIAALAAVVIGAGTFFVALLGIVLGIGLTDSSEPTTLIVAGVVLRTLLSVAVVAGVIWWAAGLRRSLSAAGWVLVALVGYLLNPFTWGGNALLTATLFGGAEQGVGVRIVGFVVDGLIWAAAAYLAATRAVRRPVRDTMAGLH